jgi:hypothetical protein
LRAHIERDGDLPLSAKILFAATGGQGEKEPAKPLGILCTTKPDKYDRYLADVFVNVTSDKGRVTSEEEVFLNIALLAAGHAVPKKAWEFSDWGEA